ncbi:hypothetical protein LCGC14_1045500 [marine sediment metagenome]|uniref:Uncharacterized protein n=1 Tax=marine sediment metagenome TaxID=412755 RepID=A0A0F9MQG9_9ZZZZ
MSDLDKIFGKIGPMVMDTDTNIQNAEYEIREWFGVIYKKIDEKEKLIKEFLNDLDPECDHELIEKWEKRLIE